MTQFEKDEFTENNKDQAPILECKPISQNHHKTGLNNFQKFMVAAMILQIVLLIVVALKISALSIAINSISGKDLPNLPGVEKDNDIVSGLPNSPSLNSSKLIEEDAIKGNKDAPVTIVEFSDYECPFCQRFYLQTLPQIEEKYIKTGKARLIYRDFPLDFHKNAEKAAEAAECAGEQDKYYEMHNKLFETGVSGGVSAFKQYATDLKLNSTKFNECLDSGKMKAEVQKDAADGQSLGVTGTPAFFINEQELVGAQPFSVFEQVIEDELKK